ncbi:helicase RepA family protein [Endozoicomonadaceae bacterium StTr2]
MQLSNNSDVSVVDPKQLPEMLRQEVKQSSSKSLVPLKPRLRFHSVGELTQNIEPTSWLIDDFIESDTLALCFAPPASYKSFFAVDVAASIATGTQWHGHDVQRGAVFYVAGEGMAGLKKRFRAWEIERGVVTQNHPLYLSSGASDLLKTSSVSELVALMTEIIQQHDVEPALIVIDTLARNFGGGNENDTKDMNLFVSNVDAIRRLWGCTVLVVHHTGHAANGRGRGSSALKAALDAEYQLTRQDDSMLVRVKNTKMKDAESPESKTFELKVVGLGQKDHRGREVTSGVLVDTDRQFEEAALPVRLSANHEALLQAVRSRVMRGESTERAVIRDDLKAQGLNVNKFSNWVKKLVDDGLLLDTEKGLTPVVIG